MQYRSGAHRVRAAGTMAVAITILIGFTATVEGQEKPLPLPRSCSPIADTHTETDILSAASASSLPQMCGSLLKLASDREYVALDCPYRERILTEIAVLQFRTGDLSGAEKTISEALNSEPNTSFDYSRSLGIQHFILATIRNSRGDYEKAQAEYATAASILDRLGPQEATAVDRIYEEMSMTYLRMGDLQSAEITLQKSLARQKNSSEFSVQKVLATRDSLMHLRYRQGRISDALKMLQTMLADYSDNIAVSSQLRAHLYRDRGEMALATHDLDGAVEHLKKSLSLLDQNGKTPDAALVLAMLGETYTARKDMSAAENAMAEAYNRSKAFEANFPEDAGSICEAYAALLTTQKRWSDARPLFLHTLEIAKDDNTRLASLQHLVKVDHHLRNTEEEMQMRDELKRAARKTPAQPEVQHTVDVLAFSSSSTH